MRLEWSILAQADRDALFDYIESDSPRAATVDDRIREQVETLARFPESGRAGRIEGTRELVINRTPYIAAYRIAGSTVRILRVLHGSRQWPDDMPDESQE
jgi:addiction module RelE/StbE family toxin